MIYFILILILIYLIINILTIETFINVNDMFDYVNTTNKANDVYYIINNIPYGNSILILAVSDNKILSLSNDWLYLIKYAYYPNNGIYYGILNEYNKILLLKDTNNITIIDEKVISFITAFSIGTVHGYAGIFSILIKYFKDIENYQQYKIIVYKNSQKGILDIIEFLINKDKLIYLDSNICYKFNNMLFIENNIHNYSNEVDNNVSLFIENNIINNSSINFENNYNKICIMKSSKSQNLTSDGIFHYDDIINFSNKYNINNIEPTDYNEIELIKIIYNCEIFIVSWGTSFFKNYVYISNKCKSISVIVYGDNFIKQYNSHISSNSVITKFKNATINYLIINSLNDDTLSKYIIN